MPEERQAALEHPFAPEGCWKFSISRPFRVDRVDQLLNEVVLPTLRRKGLTLECSFASNEVENENFWMNRMKVILELADVHVFFRIASTPQVEFEEQYSKNMVRKGLTPSLATNFQLHRKKYRILKPAVIVIRDGRTSMDRKSLFSGVSFVHCGRKFDLGDFQRRFERAVDRVISQRKRMIVRVHRWNSAANRRVASMRPNMVNWSMKMLERRAQKDPQLLARMGGSLEAARAKFEEELDRNAASRRRRQPLQIKEALIQESELTRKIAETSGALFTAEGLKPPDLSKVLEENATEAYLHHIRRGEAEFTEPFAKTLERERETIHVQVVQAFQKAGPELTSELGSNKWFARLEKFLGFVGARRYVKRVRQAKEHVHKVE